MIRFLNIIFAIILFPLIAVGQITNNSARATEYITSNQGIFKDLNIVDGDLRVSSEHVSSLSGIHHIYLQQTFQGIDILNAMAGVHMKDGPQVIHTSNRLLDHTTYGKNSRRSVSALSAVESTARHFNLPITQQTESLRSEAGVSLKQSFRNQSIAIDEINTKLVYIIEDNDLKLTWEVYILKSDDGHLWQSYVDAATNEVIKTTSLTYSCSFDHGSNGDKKVLPTSHLHNTPSKEHTPSALPFAAMSYRVYEIPLESAHHGSRTVVTEPWLKAPNASPFGWHDTNGSAGAEFTITRGNNVLAEDDPDGSNFTAGTSPDGGPTLMFDFPLDETMQPAAYLDAAITNTFYMSNIMHDVSYQYGFDEAAGNFQFNNYGNGGDDADHLIAHAQDASGTNNATWGNIAGNMVAGPDGINPYMTMFIWLNGITEELIINAPGTIAGDYPAKQSNNGGSAGGLTADLELVIDSAAPTGDGCTTITNDLTGKIAVIDWVRGNCNSSVFTANASAAGAEAVIIIDDNDEFGTTFGGNAVIPSISIHNSTGQTILAELLSTTVNGSIDTDPNPLPHRDSDLDNGIIAHEYGHGISGRLTGGRQTTSCLNVNEQMGEGWSDYFSLMMQLESGDLPEDPRGIGTYVTFQDVDGPGIRPFRYTTDLAVNPFSYNDIANVSIPHGVGSVWATMLWDMTWNLIEKHGYEPDVYATTGGNGIAMQLVMEGMKLQPCSPGFVDGRDAILAADAALFGGENSCEIWRAFARRGLGINADQGNPNITTDGTESFERPEGCPDELVLPCDDVNITYDGVTIPNGTDERAQTAVTIINSDVAANDNVMLRAGDRIEIDPLFEVEHSGELFLKVVPCDNGESLRIPEEEKLKFLREFSRESDE